MLSRLAILLLAALPALAQSTGTATVVGTVTDPTGAVVPGVRVTVRNLGTQFAYEGLTTATGSYYIPNLPSGNYEVSAEAQGFKKFVQSGLVLRINETPRIDVVLAVGNAADSVKVDATAPLLETETAGAGQVLDGEVVQKLPVMQKFVHRVLLYMPGMTNINGQHAVGQRQRAIGYSMDGVNGKEPITLRTLFNHRGGLCVLDEKVTLAECCDPSARPRGQKSERPCTFSSASVLKRHSARSPSSTCAMPAGMRIHIQRSSSPASSSSTE